MDYLLVANKKIKPMGWSPLHLRKLLMYLRAIRIQCISSKMRFQNKKEVIRSPNKVKHVNSNYFLSLQRMIMIHYEFHEAYQNGFTSFSLIGMEVKDSRDNV